MTEDSSPTTWSEADSQYAEDELQKEYADVSPEEISMVVRHAQVTVPPADGCVKLLAVARKLLSPSLGLGSASADDAPPRW